MFRSIIATAGLTLAVAPALAQTGTLDQVSPIPTGNGSAGFNASALILVWQAQIRSGLAGDLEGIRVTLTGAAGAQVNVRIRRGAAWNASPVLFETLVTKPTSALEVVFVNTASAGIDLAAGEAFVMEVQGNNTGCGMNGSYMAPPGAPFYPEPLFLNASNYADGGWRLGFETYMLPGSTCYPDCNASGNLTVADFGCFQGKYVLGDMYADCNQGGNLTVADFGCFQGKYVLGCP
ncbi:MAG: hypothetical protein ACKVU4_09700 [Phycisphaerales bacterium]